MKTTINKLYPDIWLQIFEYFNVNDLFFSLMNVTEVADEVLFNSNHRFRLRGLVIDVHNRTLPKKLLLCQLISLELNQESYIDIVGQCSELRALKLVGQLEWTISLLKNVAHSIVRLEQLVVIASGIDLLYDLLATIVSFPSLYRLEIHADQLEQRLKTSFSFLSQTKVEQFILQSCSLITWSDLSYMLPALLNIRFLELTMFSYNNTSMYSFAFLKLRCISLILVDASFKQISQLVMTTPSLTKIKLSGIVDSEEFIINHKWLELFESCPSLASAIVHLSLQQDINFFYSSIFEIALNEIGLNLQCVDNDCEYYLDEKSCNRWWSLSGIIIKRHGQVVKKPQTTC
ncbi:unnamed protein product [Rotaria magnacalcarata]|uniref:Uncharacterized protein n=1 Tax=Rotaria magnacalcarata TaxID=392030 RepID=A0A816QRQ2_9BILA|nr:unnamed protein product [Rotaria magnacalcarata]CAF4145259.1 unnamed protein product [Rotaria magnacalcarata]